MNDPVSTEDGCSPRYARQIDQLVLDEQLSPRQLGHLREHLKACRTCQQRYNRVVLAARLLDGGPPALTRPAPAELARIRQQVLQRARLAPEPRPPRRWLRFAAGFATVGLVLGVTLLLVRQRPGGPVEQPEFQTRGSSTEGLRVGLRAFCLDGTPHPRIREVTGKTSCGIDDRLTFAYTNRSNLGYLFVVGVDEHWAIKWYRPAPPARRSVAIFGPMVDEPLGRTVRLAVNHDPGLLRIFAIFSAKPLTASTVTRAVAQKQQQQQPIDRVQRLPLSGSEQRSLLLRISPAEQTPASEAAR